MKRIYHIINTQWNRNFKNLLFSAFLALTPNLYDRKQFMNYDPLWPNDVLTLSSLHHVVNPEVVVITPQIDTQVTFARPCNHPISIILGGVPGWCQGCILSWRIECQLVSQQACEGSHRWETATCLDSFRFLPLDTKADFVVWPSPSRPSSAPFCQGTALNPSGG